MPRSVFISYARDASRDHAVALYDALGGDTGPAFLDTEEIAHGERFSEALVDALFEAKVVVIFAEPAYFTRWYCLLEFRIARTPFLRIAERPGASAKEKSEAIRGLIVAMPPRGVDAMMERFPSLVQERNWPDVTDAEAIAALVLQELASDPSTLRERYAAVGDADAARAMLLEATRLPSPQRIGSIPSVPVIGLPTSIGDAFVGRADDLWRIHDVLTTERGDVATAAGLTGSLEAMGGFGKTRLALEYLYRFGTRHFRGGLFWINAEQDTELQLYDILRTLDTQALTLQELRARGTNSVSMALALTIRGRANSEPVLFLIDNVPEALPGDPPLPLSHWCPVLDDVCALATSRRMVDPAGANLINIPIDVLDAEPAVTLLRPRGAISESLTLPEWREVAEWVGRLPLALELLSAALRHSAFSPRDLFERSHRDQVTAVLDEAMDVLRGSVPEGALRGVTEAFSISYERLSLSARRAARLVAWLAPAPVPEWVLEKLDQKSFTKKVRATLSDRHFIIRSASTDGRNAWSMHRALADFLRSRSLDSVADAELVRAALVRTIKQSVGKGDLGLSRMQALSPVIVAFVEHWLKDAMGKRELRRETLEGLMSQTDWFARSFRLGGLDESAQICWQKSVDLLSRSVGEDDPLTLSALHRFADVLRSRGNHHLALNIQEQLVTRRKNRLGISHPDTLTAMDALATTLGALGRNSEAQRIWQTIHDNTATGQGEAGLTKLYAARGIASFSGNINDTVASDRKIYETARLLYGEESLTTLESLLNLAISLSSQGSYAEAQHVMEVVYETTTRVFGKKHPLALDATRSLATTFSRQKQKKRAIEMLEALVIASREIRGEDNPYTLEAMADLAHAYHNDRSYLRAKKLLYAVLEKQTKVIGPKHPQSLRTLRYLIKTLLWRGEFVSVFRLIRSMEDFTHEEIKETKWMLSHLRNRIWRSVKQRIYGKDG